LSLTSRSNTGSAEREAEDSINTRQLFRYQERIAGTSWTRVREGEEMGEGTTAGHSTKG